MKSLFNKYIWLQLILSILLLFGGTLIIVFAATGNKDILKDGLNYIAAVILFLFGLFAILAALIFESNKTITYGLLYGSASIALGVFLCTREMYLLSYLVLLLAIFFIVIGTIELIKGIILIAQKNKVVYLIVLAFVAAILFITGGILALVYRTNVELAFCIVAGILLVAAGIYELIFGVKEMVAQSKSKERRPTRKVSKKEAKKEEIKELDYTAKEE